MQLLKLTASAFRSWDNVTFNFNNGLTVITGQNGAGKSSVRMAAQYAVSGSCSGLRKSQLVKEDATTPFRVQLHLKHDDKNVIIARDMTKTSCRVGNETFSVRDASFLKELQIAIQHTLLCGDQAAFTDIPSYKRKEMLEELIPAVTLLRSGGAPYMKRLMQRMTERKFTIYNNISAARARVEEMRNTVGHIKQHVLSEEDRLRHLREIAERAMPCSQSEYNARVDNVAKLQAQIQELREWSSRTSEWLDYADAVYRNTVALRASIDKFNTDMNNVRAKIDGLRSVAEADMSLSCPHCDAKLACAECGTVVEDTGKAKETIIRSIRAEEATLEAMRAARDTAVENLKKHNVPDNEKVAAARKDVESVGRRVQSLQADLLEDQRVIQLFELAVANEREVVKMGIIQENIDRLRAQEAGILASLDEASVLLRKKQRTCEVIEKLVVNMGLSADLMTNTLPTIFFDQFLSKLSNYCNYLLSQVSDMQMLLSADDKGIHITVDGKEFAQLSSGERQRARIATTLAFSLLGQQSDTLFLDEVFDGNLDEEGTDALATLISTTMRNFYDKIVVITHDNLLLAAMQPDRTVYITKEGTSSTLKEVDGCLS